MNRFITILVKLSSSIAMGLLLFLNAFITAAVICRYVLNMPIVGSDELAGYLMVGITMLGLAYTFEKKGHIRIELFIGKLSSRYRILSNCFVGVVSLGILLVLVYTTSFFAYETYRFRTISLSGLDIPLVFPQSLIPIGFSLLFFVVFRYVVRNLRELVNKTD